MTPATQKAYRGMGMEGSVARWYEKTTRKDMAEFRKLADRLRVGLPQSADVLEVAPGPGFLSIELAKGGQFRVTGLDISKTFVDLARKNASGLGVKVDFCEGNASAMPFADKSFDLIVCRAAFKNFSEPVKALQEMHRVLRPGGTGLIVDMRRDTSMSAISEAVDRMGSGLLNRWLIKATFRFVLIKRAYTRQEFEQMLSGIPFKKVELREDLQSIGLEIWMSK